MKLNYRVGVSLLALLAAGVLAPNDASAADVMGAECSLHAAVTGGGLLGSQSYDFNVSDNEPLAAPTTTPYDVDNTDWSAMFAEAAGLATCGSWNVQGDFAYYNHSTEISVDDVDIANKDLDAASHHFGGALFWRDQQFASVGLSGSYISQNASGGMFDKDASYYRVGLFGEYYVNDRFTIGASGHYFSGNAEFYGKDFADHEGLELTAMGKFYVLPDLALTLRGDYMNSTISYDDEFSGVDPSFDGFAVSAEAEYLFWDQGLSVFGGARYAAREWDYDQASIQFEDMQVYAGLKIALGGGASSLVDRDRSGVYDNTSVMLEKLPNAWASIMPVYYGNY